MPAGAKALILQIGSIHRTEVRCSHPGMQEARDISRFTRNDLGICVPADILKRRIVLISLLLICVLTLAAGANARELRIESFHSELVVLPDSSLDVTET